MNAVKFTSNNDGGWQGNGFGTIPNSYTVTVNGKEFGWAVKRDRGWMFFRRAPHTIQGVVFDYEKHPSVTEQYFGTMKAAVRTLARAA